MGLIQGMWEAICKFFIGVKDAFITVLKGIVKFFGTVWDFFNSLFNGIVDLIADGIASLFILFFGNKETNDPLAEELGKIIEGAKAQGKMPAAINLNDLKIAAKVVDGKVTEYKAYQIDENISEDRGMKTIDDAVKRDNIIELSA